MDRLPDQRTCPAGSAPVTGNIPFPQARVKSLRVRVSFSFAPPPVHALAREFAQSLPATHTAAFASAGLAFRRAAPQSLHSTLSVGRVAASVFPIPATNDHPRASALRTL